MKHLLLILFLPMIFNISLMGQDKSEQDRQKDILDCLVKMGADPMVTLNICESKYLNFNYQTIKSTFDFHGKRVAFFKGNAGTIKSTKKEYFDRIKYFVNQKGYLPLCTDQLVIFNEDQVAKTGYDAAIVYQSKRLVPINEVVRKLRKSK